ncbi:AlpA family phage regulatory protein [Sphingobium sp. AR-3-1]|uniref:AlpA family phage regulatory protein n=1 Tax=Sphingobium psychrophilum TaxID=2728834 RepID=A0A7X9WT78_9SPHN|nr:AlpA family phage regulatory protein [Sphingobium psychrophilum]NML09486.1 AlpA family phage regulatory protein [Sphingobium psychrophilum]
MKSDISQFSVGPATSADAEPIYRKDRRSDRLLRTPDVTARTGMSVSAIYRLETAGRFPRRRRIGLRSVAWYESDIEEFVANPSG